MITGYATFEHDPDAPDFVNDFNRVRLDMIESTAASYAPIVPHRVDEGDGTTTLNLHAPVEDEDDGEDLVEFVRELEDTNLGYLIWETCTYREAALLESARVAVLSVEVRGIGLASHEGPLLRSMRVRRASDGELVHDEPTAFGVMRAAGIPEEAPGLIPKEPGLFYRVLTRDEAAAATEGETRVDGEAYLLEISP